LDALVSDHMPVGTDEKHLPFAEATPGATGLELLLSLALKWGAETGPGDRGLRRALSVVTAGPVGVLGSAVGSLAESAGRLVEGGVADVCIFDPQASWTVTAEGLRSQGKHTPFAFEHGGVQMLGRVRATLVAGTVAYEAAA
jgi:dihydroorotase